MTEAEWCACRGPVAMLKALGHDASERKLRCFIAACEQRSPTADKDRTLLLDQPWNHAWGIVWEEDALLEQEAKSSLLREVFGNPFRPVSVDTAWLTPNVVRLARIIYQDRAFERVPVLAEALEAAACTNPDILAHCRGPGPHVEGCWLLDLLLGKE